MDICGGGGTLFSLLLAFKERGGGVPTECESYVKWDLCAILISNDLQVML